MRSGLNPEPPHTRVLLVCAHFREQGRENWQGLQETEAGRGGVEFGFRD